MSACVTKFLLNAVELAEGRSGTGMWERMLERKYRELVEKMLLKVQGNLRLTLIVGPSGRENRKHL